MSVGKNPEEDFLKNYDNFDLKFVKKVSPFLKGLYQHYFRCEVEGWENIPDSKVLFVGNHNGLLTFEVLMLGYAWWKKFGDSRRALGLAHGIVLNYPPFKGILPKLGAIPAHPEVAFHALERGYSLMVYPGGDREAFRPFGERKKIDFYQRKGFIRLALRAGVPIIPIVSIGAHESYVILSRGEELAVKLGLKKHMRLHGIPITVRSVFFMWCVVMGMVTFFPLLLAPLAFASIFVPLPAKMKFRFLPAIDPVSMMDSTLSEEENFQKIYDSVIQSMQSVMHQEYSRRKLPIIG